MVFRIFTRFNYPKQTRKIRSSSIAVCWICRNPVNDATIFQQSKNFHFTTPLNMDLCSGPATQPATVIHGGSPCETSCAPQEWSNRNGTPMALRGQPPDNLFSSQLTRLLNFFPRIGNFPTLNVFYHVLKRKANRRLSCEKSVYLGLHLSQGRRTHFSGPPSPSLLWGAVQRIQSCATQSYPAVLS